MSVQEILEDCIAKIKVTQATKPQPFYESVISRLSESIALLNAGAILSDVEYNLKFEENTPVKKIPKNIINLFRQEYAKVVEGDGDNPEHVTRANLIIAGMTDLEMLQHFGFMVGTQDPAHIFMRGWKTREQELLRALDLIHYYSAAYDEITDSGVSRAVVFELAKTQRDHVDPVHEREKRWREGGSPLPESTKGSCEHDWQYIGTDPRGSHKGEDHYKCRKPGCGEYQYRID